MKFLALLAIVSCAMASNDGATDSEKTVVDYSHAGEDWEGDCASGKEQSPINIASRDVIENEDLPPLELKLTPIKGYAMQTHEFHTAEVKWPQKTDGFYFTPGGSEGGGTLVSTATPGNDTAEEEEPDVSASEGPAQEGEGEETIEADEFATEAVDPVEVDGQEETTEMEIVSEADGDETRNYLPLLQFHFHAPSEHTFNGVHYPLEMHMVFMNATTGQVRVVGVMFQYYDDDEENPFIQKVIDGFPTDTNMEIDVDAELDLNKEVLNDIQNAGYITYSGSFTTPPCTEGVKFYLMRGTQPISVQQATEFSILEQEVMHGGRSRGGNNRPPQPINDREIVMSQDLSQRDPHYLIFPCMDA